MLQVLVGKIADLWNAPDAWIEAELDEVLPPGEASAGPDDVFRAQFLELARTRQRQNGNVVTGLLTIVWQGSRLSAFGTRHSDLRALTEMVTDVVLEQMAGRPDFFLPYDTDNVVLCFASAHREITELRAGMMAHALRAALVQRMPDLAGKIRIDSVITEVDPVDAVARGRDLAVGLVDRLCQARDRSAVVRSSMGNSALLA